MPLGALISEIAAGIACAIGVAAVVEPRRSVARWAFLAGMLGLALEAACGAQVLRAEKLDQAIQWQSLELAAGSLLPGSWLLFSLTYSRGNAREGLVKWRAVLAVLFLLPLLAGIGLGNGLIDIQAIANAGHSGILRLTVLGRGLSLGVLLGSLCVLMNLERTFRASVGTMRWRVKFMVLGLAVILGVRLYICSQTLLYSAENPGLQPLKAVALLVGSGLIAWSMIRAGFTGVDVYPSGAVLQSSITLLLGGIYLLIIGALAKLLTLFGQYAGLPLKALLILLSLVVLSILVLSERVRQRFHQLVSRHFKRPLYNYRQIWMAFAERTSSLLDETALCREVAKLVSETFQVLSVTIWLVDENRKLAFGASTSLAGPESQLLVKDDGEIAALVDAMHGHSEPVDIEQGREKWVETLKACNPHFFKTGGTRMYMPLTRQGEVLGLISLGDRVYGLPFQAEDKELLKCIGEQVANSLLNLQLSRKLLRGRELEAFQTMSAFFVHDLKNTANALSLLLQNLAAHFNDPAFRDDAERAVSNSVKHLTDLIGRLGMLRQKLELHTVEMDLNATVTGAVARLSLPEEKAVSFDFQALPTLRADPENIQKVVTNLVLNAREAAGSKNTVEIATSRQNGWAVLTVRDHGCGMSPEFMSKSLFRPFQTTKKTGIGIGMFQSKMIVEAHRGRIEVESEPGKGSTFRVLLPLRGN